METILNLCAEYNHDDGSVELMRSGLLGAARGLCSGSGGGMSLPGDGRNQRVRENDEEIQREESSSTESTHQEVKDTLVYSSPVLNDVLDLHCVTFCYLHSV